MLVQLVMAATTTAPWSSPSAIAGGASSTATPEEEAAAGAGEALLFLSAGIVIHNLGGEQDIRKMGGLAKKMPLAFWTFAIGTVAIAGIPPFAGFFSKDAIIDSGLALHHPLLTALLIVAALLTAFYMFRLLFSTFAGAYRGEQLAHLLG